MFFLQLSQDKYCISWAPTRHEAKLHVIDEYSFPDDLFYYSLNSFHGMKIFFHGFENVLQDPNKNLIWISTQNSTYWNKYILMKKVHKLNIQNFPWEKDFSRCESGWWYCTDLFAEKEIFFIIPKFFVFNSEPSVI